jgi:serine/threonine protein kinase/formylglycine-generating enzyme required for sulfatase activity
MPPGDDRPCGDATSEMTLPSAGPPADPVRPGGLLGQYRLLERIGVGGMGEVFKAVHPTMQRVVAVKIMAASLVQEERARARFRREVQSAARLAHPNIVMAYDAAEEAGRCFLVMEYVEGRDAGALLHEFGPAPTGTACDVIRQAALGLQHAHEQGMIHRDIKPGNLVIAARRPPRGAGLPTPAPPPPGWSADPVVKVLDFGLARFQAGESEPATHVPGSTPLTREGHVVGTPEFMAPEQACNSGRTDIRSDIYSLGCTFYCLLTGQPPFIGPSLLEVMVQHLQSAPPPVVRARPDVPPGVASVLERMLAKRPEDRYQTPGEVAEALAPFAASLRPTEAIVLAGRPVNVFPDTGTAAPAAAANPTQNGPAAPRSSPTGITRPTAYPAAVPRPPAPVGRSFVGCFGLCLVLFASMAFAWVFLLRPDGGPARDSAADGPRAGPVPGMLLVHFPAGRLDPSYGPPRSSVEVPRDFEVSATEVTRDQFGLFVRAAHFQTDAEKGTGGQRGAVLRKLDLESSWSPTADWDAWRADLAPDTPVVCVSWDDAVQFCNWLSERQKLPRCYTLQGGPGAGWSCDFRAAGYRLPTEAEWEYAARAGDREFYPANGEVLRGQGWFAENSNGSPHPVGTKVKNRRDLCDVWGNAWEWCWDWYSTPAGKQPLSPTGPESGSERVMRGGGWCNPAPVNAGQTRQAQPPDYRASDVGFRVVRTLPR